MLYIWQNPIDHLQLSGRGKKNEITFRACRLNFHPSTMNLFRRPMLYELKTSKIWSHERTDSVSCYAPSRKISKMGMNSNKLFMFHVLSTSEKWRDILSSGFLPSGIHIHQRGKPKQTTFKHVPSGPPRPIACFQNHASNQDGTWQWCSLAEENHLQP